MDIKYDIVILKWNVAHRFRYSVFRSILWPLQHLVVSSQLCMAGKCFPCHVGATSRVVNRECGRERDYYQPSNWMEPRLRRNRSTYLTIPIYLSILLMYLQYNWLNTQCIVYVNKANYETSSLQSTAIDTGMSTFSSQRGFRSFSPFGAHTWMVGDRSKHRPHHCWLWERTSTMADQIWDWFQSSKKL